MEPTCDIKSVYESVEACPGQRIQPGIRRRLYYIPKVKIVVWPTLPGPSDQNVKMEDLAKYSGDFTLTENGVFSFIDLKDEASNVTFETVGEDPSKLFNNQANAIVAGQPDAVKGFSRQALNEDLVYVYQQRDGKFCVLGNEAFKCHTSPSGDTGAEVTGSTTTSIAIQVYDECPVPTYVGKLPLSSTEYLDCQTGKVMKYADLENQGHG